MIEEIEPDDTETIEQVKRMAWQHNEEHVKGICFQQTGAVGDLVHACGHKHADPEYRQCMQDGFMFRLYIATAQKEYANDDHRTVADHGLDIDTDGADKYGRGVEHHTDPCKYGIAGQVGTGGTVDCTLFGQACKQPHIHRRRAELEGKGVPGVIKSNAVFIGKAEINLLIHLQQYYCNSSAEYKRANTLV